jgi:hypothetical protein
MAALKEKQIGVVVSFSVLNCVAIVAMGLRFYSIRIVRRNFKLHDALCIVSLVMLIGYTTCLLIGEYWLLANDTSKLKSMKVLSTAEPGSMYLRFRYRQERLK